MLLASVLSWPNSGPLLWGYRVDSFLLNTQHIYSVMIILKPLILFMIWINLYQRRRSEWIRGGRVFIYENVTPERITAHPNQSHKAKSRLPHCLLSEYGGQPQTNHITVTSHYEHHGVSNNQPLNCFCNSLYMLKTNWDIKALHHLTCEVNPPVNGGNPQVTGGFP